MFEEDRIVSEGEVSEVSEEAEDDLESLRQALAQIRKQAERYLANWQRAEADFRNYKRREEEEKSEFVKMANSALVCDILPVLDAFDRAFKEVPADDERWNWIEGFKHVQRMLLDVLSKHGLSEVKCVGEVFDPRIHEAVARGEGGEGLVINEVRKGYWLKDKLLRAPQVVVGKGGEGGEPQEEST